VFLRDHLIEFHGVADLENFKGGAKEAQGAESRGPSRVGVLGERQRLWAPPHQLGGVGSTVSSPKRVQGRALQTEGVLCNFSSQDDFSEHFKWNVSAVQLHLGHSEYRRNFTLKSGGDQWRRQDLVSGGTTIDAPKARASTGQRRRVGSGMGRGVPAPAD